MQTLNRAVYRGEPLPEPALRPMPSQYAPDSSVQQNTEIRLQQIERDLQALTGRVEEQNYEIEKLKARISDLENAPPQVAQVPAQPPQQPSVPYVAHSNPQAGYIDPNSIPQPYQQTLETTPPYAEPAFAQPGLSQAMQPAALYETSYGILKSGNFDAAEQSFKKFLEEYPEHKLASNATYWLGETYYVRNQYDEAARVFAHGYQKFPSGAKTPDSLLKLGLSLHGLGQNQEACIALKQLKTEFPGGSASVLQRADAEMENFGCE